MRSPAARLYVLGLLNRHGPLHGHALRQLAHKERVDLWTGVRPGSLYAALRQLEGEGLLEVERTERSGRLPLRTVYRITRAGLREFHRLRRAVLADTTLRPEPVDLAVALADDLSREDLVGLITERQRQLARDADRWRALKAKAWPHLSPEERMVFAHGESRYRAEISWHQEFVTAMAAPVPGARADAGAAAPS